MAFPIQHSLKRQPVYAIVASVFFWFLTFVHLSIVIIVPFIGAADLMQVCIRVLAPGYFDRIRW